MLAITWLIVVDRSKLSLAYTTRSIHSTEPGAVLAPKVAIAIPWVSSHDVLSLRIKVIPPVILAEGMLDRDRLMISKVGAD